MKLLKNGVTLFLCLALLLGSALANEIAPALHMLALREEGGALKAVVYSTLKGNLQPGDFEAKMGGEPVSISSVASLSRDTLGTTFLFVLDMPSSKGGLSDLKQLATELIGQISGSDNIGVIYSGSAFQEPQLVSKTEALSLVNAITFAKPPALTLNTAITQTLGYLRTTSQIQARACVVILSTGYVYSALSGSTDSEVENAVKESRSTIYSVSLLEKGSPKARVERSSYLGSLARLSKGGLALETAGSKGEDMVKAFAENEERFMVLSIRPDQWAGKKDIRELFLSIRDGSHVLEDSMKLDASLQAALAEAAIRSILTVPPTSAPTPNVSGQPEPAVSDSLIPTPTEVPPPMPLPMEFWALIAGGAVLLALIIILIVVMAKRRKPVPGPNPRAENDGTVPGPNSNPTVVEPDSVPSVTLTGIGKSEGTRFALEIRDGIVIGRDNNNARVRLSDPKVSHKHALLTYTNGIMRIEDLGSRNGIRVNSETEKITAPRVLRQSDTFKVGDSEFQITWADK